MLVLRLTTFKFYAQRRRLHLDPEISRDCRKKIISKEKHFRRSPLRTNLKFRENICAEVSGQRTVLERLFKIFHQGRELILTIFELRVEVENFIKISGCSNLLSFYKLSK